ncbi:MAG: Uncharacterised protein [Synechococcus sp. CC9902]|nr:MAG: Uncharacterised protein [Synechococcus sp. CC9902]|tara:strand:+ start:527 stop:805 length:279 start_codon:yes stop_codon:yes gene_type:complete
MNRPPAIVWLVLLVLLLPTAAGRILLDVVGGVALVLVAVPLILTGLGWIGWKLLQMQAENTQQSTVGSRAESSTPASEVTIDVTAQDVESDS